MLAYENILRHPKGKPSKDQASQDEGHDVLRRHLDKLAKKNGGQK